MRFKVVVGDTTGFDGLKCSLDEADHEERPADIQKDVLPEHFARKLAAVVAAGFVAVAGAYGLVTADWNPLSNLWVVLGPIVGALTGISMMPGKTRSVS